MSHRQKNEHKSRHRTHAAKSANLVRRPAAHVPPAVPAPQLHQQPPDGTGAPAIEQTLRAAA